VITLEYYIKLYQDTYKDLVVTRVEKDNWIETCKQTQRNTDYYRDLLIQIGEVIGEDAKVCDDGTVVPDILVAKVPELAISIIENYKETKKNKTYNNYGGCSSEDMELTPKLKEIKYYLVWDTNTILIITKSTTNTSAEDIKQIEKSNGFIMWI